MSTIATAAQPLKGAELRKAVAEWTGLGCAVKIGSDGTIEVTPPSRESADPDLVNWSRK
ncbi:hypothetical protein ACX9MO_16625 [Pseudooceanicola sp. 502str34]